MDLRPVRLSEFGLGHEHRVDHLPSFRNTLSCILPRSEIGPDDVFIDFGSGMGCVVVMAATRYPFKRVIGVEISTELQDVARRNVERNRKRFRSQHIELVTADVLDFVLPDDVTVVYLYNPFTGPVFDKVVRELERSLERSPREMRVIYLNPAEEERLLAPGFMQLVRSARISRRSRSMRSEVRLYSSK